MWIGTPSCPASHHPMVCMTFFLFRTIFDMCIVLSTRIMDEIPIVFVLRKKKYITKSCKPERVGAILKFMYKCTIRQGKFLFSSLR